MNSNQKGKRGEREAAKAVSDALGCSAKRGVQYCGSPDSPDIVTDISGVHFEVKRTQKLEIYKSVAQAVEDCGEKVPVVLHRRNHSEWLAIVRLEDLPQLASRIMGEKS